MDDNKVVFMKFRTDNADTETEEMLACKICRNKMFSVVYNVGDEYPTMKCGACGSHVGKIGWTDEDDT